MLNRTYATPCKSCSTVITGSSLYLFRGFGSPISLSAYKTYLPISSLSADMQEQACKSTTLFPAAYRKSKNRDTTTKSGWQILNETSNPGDFGEGVRGCVHYSTSHSLISHPHVNLPLPAYTFNALINAGQKACYMPNSLIKHRLVSWLE